MGLNNTKNIFTKVSLFLHRAQIFYFFKENYGIELYCSTKNSVKNKLFFQSNRFLRNFVRSKKTKWSKFVWKKKS